MGLGKRFWQLQLGELVSLLSDASVWLGGVFWIFIDRQFTAEEVVAVMTPGPLAWAICTPICGVLADTWPRTRLLALAGFLRAALHAWLCWLAAHSALSVPVFAFAAGASGVFTALFDAAASPAVLDVVPEEQRERALGYSLVLPRAGFYVTVVVTLLVVGLFGFDWTYGLGAGWLALAAWLAWRIPSKAPGLGAKSFLGMSRGLLSGAFRFVSNPGLVWLGIVLFGVHFVVHPLYWVGPMVGGAAASRPAGLPDNLEIFLCLGVIACALSIGRASTRISGSRLMGVGLTALGVGLALLGQELPPAALYGASFVIGFGLMIASGIANARVLLDTDDALRGRANAFGNLLFDLGGDAGFALVLPFVQVREMDSAMLMVAAPLVLVGLFVLLTGAEPRVART